VATSPPRVPTRCPACGRQFHLSAANPRPPAVCPDCGSATDLPPDRGGGIPGEERHLIAQGTTDDDGKPYGVFGEKPIPPCPSCGKPLPEDAEVCGRCNWHREVGRVLPRTYAPIDETWEAGWPFRWRMAGFLAFQAMNVVTALLVLRERGSLPTTAFGWVVMSALQAFVLGTYDRVRLTRTTKGKVAITKVWRVCFVPLPANVIRWREHERLVVRQSDVGEVEWMILAVLLPGVLTAFLWWWFAIRPGRVMVALTQNLGDPVSVLYAGTNTEHAREIAEAARDATDLPYDPLG
jgi:hypothetical protein